MLRALPSRTSYMFGITVNKHGHRFIDEGSDPPQPAADRATIADTVTAAALLNNAPVTRSPSWSSRQL